MPNLKFKNLCELHNTNIVDNIVLIKGQINSLNSKLTINDQSSTLEVLSIPKHIEEIHYNNVATLESHLLSFKKVINPDGYNASYYHNNIVKHRMLTKWLMLEFNSNSEGNILHHFKYDKLNINGVNHIVENNRIYAVLDREIDGNKLIRFNEKRTISVFVDKSLKNSTVSIQEDKVSINNITLSNLPDKTVILFQESENKTLPVSVKLLKDSFNPTRSKREINQESENEELKTITAQDATQNNQANTEQNEGNLVVPSFNILSGAEPSPLEVVNQEESLNTEENVDQSTEEDYSFIDGSEENIDDDQHVSEKPLDNQSLSNTLLDNITIPFIKGAKLLKDVISSNMSKLITGHTNSPEEIPDYTDYIVKENTSRTSHNLAISSANNDSIQTTAMFDINGNLTLAQLIVHKIFGTTQSRNVSSLQERNINKLASEILPNLYNYSASDFSYSSQPQWYKNIYQDEYEEIVRKQNYRSDSEKNSSEAILADSIKIFGEVME